MNVNMIVHANAHVHVHVALWHLLSCQHVSTFCVVWCRLWLLDSGFAAAVDKVDAAMSKKAASCPVLWDKSCHLPPRLLLPFANFSSAASPERLLPWFLKALARRDWNLTVLM